MTNFQVAIDGPAGSGKSTISKILATKLGFTHIDTGAMYRAVTLKALRLGIDVENPNNYDFVRDLEVLYKENHVYLDGEDVTDFIRTKEVTDNASAVARVGIVRDRMVEFQRESAKTGLIIMDGRDIGTVVLPNANLKVFLTAEPLERAKRRQIEHLTSGRQETLEAVYNDLVTRDYKDSHREIAPLKQASDAILLDTTHMTLHEVSECVAELINERM